MLETLTQDERDFVDELLFANIFMWAFQFVRAKTDYGFNEVIDILDKRKTKLGIDFNGHTLSRAGALATLSRLQEKIREKICMIEGSWDGDSFGWFIRLSAITEQPSSRHPRYTDYGLCLVRSIQDQVEYATAWGEELAQLAGTTFYLTSVELDEYKRWWDTQPRTMR